MKYKWLQAFLILCLVIICIELLVLGYLLKDTFPDLTGLQQTKTAIILQSQNELYVTLFMTATRADWQTLTPEKTDSSSNQPAAVATFMPSPIP